MSAPRFFVDVVLCVGHHHELPADVAHHALRVLRLRDGEPVVLFNGHGGEYRATLVVDGAAVRATIEAFDAIERESPLQLTLIQALVAADKLDWIIEKAVELGTRRLVVVPMQRGIVRLDAARRARRLLHWREIARAACGQCGRNLLPAIEFSDTFDAALAGAAVEQPRLALVPAATSALPRRLTGGATLLVGPEGGFSKEELLRAKRAGFGFAQIGPRILRTETAGLAALAALQALSGDLAAPDH